MQNWNKHNFLDSKKKSKLIASNALERSKMTKMNVNGQ